MSTMPSKPVLNLPLAEIESIVALMDNHATAPPNLIAIDGHSAAGKTTLAEALAVRFSDATIVHMDDFYRVMDEEERAALDGAGGYAHYYDWQRLEEQVLKPLSEQREGHYQKYDWVANRLGAWNNVRATGIVLIEGCYAARPELAAYYDVILVVETPAAKRLQRQTERADATREWLERWDKAERYYMEHYPPQRYADMVVAGALYGK